MLVVISPPVQARSKHREGKQVHAVWSLTQRLGAGQVVCHVCLSYRFGSAADEGYHSGRVDGRSRLHLGRSLTGLLIL